LTQMIRVNLPAEKVQTEEAQHPGDGVPAQKAETPQTPTEELVLQGIDHDAALEHGGTEEALSS
ncbi:MAG: hypothetical protein IJP92_13390, partial [Lachnospiraceae bacterium]|nr:hypothetical protein [Lachnospiraceae bacterium]